MKKIVALLLTLSMLLGMVAVASAETWTCQACGTQNEHNFCGECGAKKSTDWKCPNCGTTNEGKFCGECGTARTSGGAAPAPAPANQLAGLEFRPRVDFYYQDYRKTVYTAETDELYAGDYSDDTRMYVALNVINAESAEKTFTLTATVNGKDYEFNPYTISGNDDHGFFISAQDLRVAGQYDVTWYAEGVEVATHSVTVHNGKSDFYRWLNATLSVDVSMCVWNDVTSKRVRNGIEVGYLSQLGANETYSPHLIVTNNTSVPTSPLYISFFANNNVVYWENQVLEGDHTINYLNSSFKQDPGETDLIMYINGIEVGRGVMRIAE